MKYTHILAGIMAVCFALAPIAAEQENSDLPGDIQSAIAGCNANVPTNAQTGMPVPFAGVVSLTPGSLPLTDSMVGSLYVAPATGAGGYLQGSPGSEPCRSTRESQFTHILTHNLLVMEEEVSQGTWYQLRTYQPTLPTVSFNHISPVYPVEMITWYEAVLFANLLSVERGYNRCYYTNSSKTTPIDSSNYNNNNTIYFDYTADGFRLPTEGEWEYFARAGTTSAFWANEPMYTSASCSWCLPGYMANLDGVAWWCANSGNKTNVVGMIGPNPWNLKDVHGNVDEWCWDWAGAYPKGVVTDYSGPASGAYRIARGGNCTSYAKDCRSASEGYSWPYARHPTNGFRLVRSLSIHWNWDFGDGSLPSAQSNPTHAYTNPGNYTWTMTADVLGQLCVKTGQITVGGTGSGPTITNITSKTSKAGSSATIYGTGFSTDKKKDVVYFGTKKVKSINKAKTTCLKVTIPKVAKGAYAVTVLVNGVTSNAFTFTVK